MKTYYLSNTIHSFLIFIFLFLIFPIIYAQDCKYSLQQKQDLLRLKEKYPWTCNKVEDEEIKDAIKLAQAFPYEAKESMDWNEALNFSKVIHSLAYAALSNVNQQTIFNDFIQKTLDNKIIARIPKLIYSSYGNVREIPFHLLSALPACNIQQKKDLIKAVKVLIEFNKLYASTDIIKQNINTDYIYNVLPHLFVCALQQPDETQAIADLKAFSHYLSSCTEYSQGDMDGLKIDGTGFHHRTHYNGYMYAYKTWVEYIYRLKGTDFRIDKNAYERIKRAVVSEYLMANLPISGEQHYFANSLAGRHPFAGLQVDFGSELFQKLVEIGGDIQGETIDKDLAAYYNAFFQTNVYKDITPHKLDGFYQFNYSPVGIYRYKNWVATMRCPTTRFWGGEIYSKTNRFGRYQSHGSLEIIYNGPLKESGYPDNWERFSGKRGGWDWNVVPGTTTVHYTDWKEMMPNGNNTDRFDQWAKTTNFSGALSWKDCGIFAASFNQGDHWGGRRFEPTNLSFCKSVFVFDGFLLSLGSGICSNGNYGNDQITATNLFQAINNPNNDCMILNGEKIRKGKNVILETDKNNWLITPYSTGYIIPAGNDPLVVVNNTQSTPGPEGITESSFNSLEVSKAYINHGVKPSNKKYCFVVVPGTTPQELSAHSRKLFHKKKGIFEICQQADSLHIIKHKPSKTLAYALFAPAKSLQDGFLQASDTPLLLMERFSKKENLLDLAICSPDLRPQNDKEKKTWKSSPTHSTLIFKGCWHVKRCLDKSILSCSPDGEYTKLTVELKDGLPCYIQLTPVGR
ncbi:chondroitinase family polysaccharide lyase [uncultured Mediterranea sp.]|uniref:chondroitinase family polysaccharide lyase n=1 Tax=uncultured Mediterranea sp. TaxID=1926662 RepID=UPI0027D9B84D|nr:chondroitinase family polysaccharide lyase [uncultured Mediterranea sp.]